MAALLKNTTIQNAEYALSDQENYQYLKQLGLDAIIRSASERWTDYNEHDPGITILEVLVYALTDLGYRTDFSIGDILAQQQLPLEDLAKDQFYTASTILTVNPVSLNDLRRVIIDIDGVDNAWVLPLDDPINPFQGLLEIFVNPVKKLEEAADQKALEKKVRKRFFKHRNLSQDLSKIVFRKALELGFRMELILDPKKVKHVEKEIAEVLLEIKTYLSEKVYFQSLQQMMVETNGNVNAIFNGPELEYGFLPDEQLKPMTTSLNVVHLIPIIQKTEGVVMIGELEFKTGLKSKEWLKKINIRAIERLVLGPLEEQEIDVLLGDVPYKINQESLKFEYEKLLHQQSNSKLVSAKRDLPITLGDYRDMETYFSVQNEFPAIYGMEPFGPPPDADTQRLAQIQQLKSYLLIFDQIMANYLAQLAHLSKLFSWNKEVQRTYFFQGLSGAVNSLEDLLVDPVQGGNATKDAKEILEHYLKKLAHFTESESDFLDRRNRFLDHLLARFGRQLTIENFNLKNELQSVIQTNEHHAIEAKLRVLENYPDLSANRGQAFSTEDDFKKQFSGLRNWVETLFFMDPESLEKFRFNQRFCKKEYVSIRKEKKDRFEKGGFVFTKKDGKVLSFEGFLSIGQEPDHYHIEESTTYRVLLYKREEGKKEPEIYTLNKVFKSKGAAQLVLDELLSIANFQQSGFVFIREEKDKKLVDVKEIMRIGTSEDNYYIDYRDKHGFRILLYEQTDLLKASKVYTLDRKYKTPEKALAVIKNLVALLQKYDRTSESVYILEHLLMRPMSNERYFGLDLLDKDQDIWLGTKKWYSKDALDYILKPLRTNQFYYCIADDPKMPCIRFVKKRGKKKKQKETAKFQFKVSPKQNDFGETNYLISMQYYRDDEKVKFKGNKLYATPEDAKKAIASWIHRLDQKITVPNDQDVLFKARLSPLSKPSKKKFMKLQTKTLNFDQFSNIITIVLPKWPSRFQEKGFKNKLEQSLHNEAPSQLWLNVLWLGKSKFQRFQKLFGRWWDAYVAGYKDAYCYREDIMNFIIKESFESLEILNPPVPVETMKKPKI